MCEHIIVLESYGVGCFYTWKVSESSLRKF